ncbi:protein ACCELERATED CELL DEATH 6-like, partial [Vigna umbellata]|uniref:protein ACCELERATED CELL DEATH 6-like n=1 Tax=Vigna umbellata TaxID=87088 RepID=UPI001F5F028E
IDEETIKQKRPRRNTVLHIAALYGNDKCVEKVLQIGEHLLLKINGNGDTPLHVAARAGKISTLEKLVAALLHRNSEEAKETILVTNKQGNTFFHEALLNGHKNVMNILVSSPAFEQLAEETVFVSSNNNDKSVLDLAIEKGYEDIVDDVLTRMIPTNEGTYKKRKKRMVDSDMHMDKTENQGALPDLAAILKDRKVEGRMALMDIEMDTRDISTPTFSKNQGARSPAIMAILKENKGILEKILNRKKEWIHDKDEKERNALHYAASKGYLNGVECLLQKCDTCNMETDRYGFYPLHLASACGRIEVVKKLLENCPNPREIIDKKGRNIVHIAAIMGKFDVVSYVLHDANGVKDMINDKDYDGNTPLHLAASHYRPKIVQALTWDTSVDLNWLNNNNQTPIDAFEQFKQQNNPPIVQASI